MMEARCIKMIRILPLLLLTACGGGGGSSNPAPALIDTNTPATTAPPVDTTPPPPQYPEEGTLIGESYCAVVLEDDQDKLDIVSDRINHLLREDRLQDYADGSGGEYTDRLVHIDQTCFEQMPEPQACNTTATATGDQRYDFITCDGVKQTTPVSFPFDPEQVETAVIDILFIVDTKLTEEDRDGMTVEEFVDKQVFDSNHMYISSGTKTLVRVAGIKMVDVAAGDLYRQYYAFFGGRQEFNGLSDWQREAGADFAFLFKKRPDAPIACGVASLDATEDIYSTRGIIQCFHNSVFQETVSTRYYNRAQETFAHELGHLMGAAHEVSDAASTGLFEYSFGYNLPGYDAQEDNPDYNGRWGGYGSIMSYADLPTGRFSNYNQTCYYPDEAGSFAGQAVKMGTEDGEPTNNGETIERTRYVMSQLHELNHAVGTSVYGGNPQFNFSPIQPKAESGAFDLHVHDSKVCLF